MISFDPNDPFPLLDEEACSYEEAKEHAAEVDSWLGLQIDDIESRLIEAHSGSDARKKWIGLNPRSLQTPYTEIRQMLARLNPASGSTLIDLGAGYGRMGHVIGRHYPQIKFIGYEVVPERCFEGQGSLERFQYKNVELRCADLLDPVVQLEAAEYYFVYDFSDRESIEKVLGELRQVAQKRPVTVVGRGRSSRDSIERHHPWLSQVVQPEHYNHYSIYRSGLF